MRSLLSFTCLNDLTIQVSSHKLNKCPRFVSHGQVLWKKRCYPDLSPPERVETFLTICTKDRPDLHSNENGKTIEGAMSFVKSINLSVPVYQPYADIFCQ